jgi:hypothetical protein
MSEPAGAEDLVVERSGGFAGMTQQARVPLADLSDRERAALQESFRQPPSPPPGPDRFVYRLRARGREALVQEDRVPPGLQPLLARLAASW